MGRRPNQLVFEFFERGRKLEDASNRYEHTCKRCRELFPKGRVDGLITHLLRRCPHVTLEDREVVLHYVQQNPERSKARANPTDRTTSTSQHNQQSSGYPRALLLPGTGARIGKDQRQNFQQSLQGPQTVFRPVTQHSAGSLPTALQSQDVDGQQTAMEPDVPFHLFQQQQQSALDTLAEVSRRHLDFATQRCYPEQEEVQTQYDPGRALAEQALMAQLQAATARSYFEPQSTTHATEGSQRDSTNPPAGEPAATLGFPESDQVNSIARSCDQAMHQEGDLTLDPQLGVMGAPDNAATDLQSEGPPAFSEGNENDANNAILGQTPPPVHDMQDIQGLPHHADDNNLLQTVMNHRSRARFSAVRRKEVQETRKRGACMRCRMLKKSCSDGTPCKACKSVETARLWKTKCLRTRLADEFSLWSTGLFHASAQTEELGAIQSSIQLLPPGRIDVRLFPSSDRCMTFTPTQYNGPGNSEQAVQAVQATPLQIPGLGNTSVLLLDEDDTLSDKLEEYVHQVVGTYIEEENTTFLRATLHQAQALMHEEETLEPALAKGRSGRVCYNLQNQLLSDVIELWAETRLLVAPHSIDLQLRYNPSLNLKKNTATAQWNAQAGLPESLISSESQSHKMIKCQLLSVVESRCRKLGKSVMNELERRLLQRRQVSRFATFLSAIILLGCVERLTGFYRALDTDGLAPDSASMLAVDRLGDASTTASELPWGAVRYPDAARIPQDWPQKESADTLWEQGEHFADLLIMLLRMRALPPKTAWTAEGRLVVIEDQPQSVTTNGPTGQERDDGQVHAMAAWLDPLELNVEELKARSSAAFPPRSAGVSAWDMQFISRVLLPESLQGTAEWQ